MTNELSSLLVSNLDTLNIAKLEAENVLNSDTEQVATLAAPPLKLEEEWERDWSSSVERRDASVREYEVHVEASVASETLLRDTVASLNQPGLTMTSVVSKLRDLPYMENAQHAASGLEEWRRDFTQACNTELLPLFGEMEACRLALEQATEKLNSRLMEQESRCPVIDSLVAQGEEFLGAIDTMRQGISSLENATSEAIAMKREELSTWRAKQASMLSHVASIKKCSDRRKKRKREKRRLEDKVDDEGLEQ